MSMAKIHSLEDILNKDFSLYGIDMVVLFTITKLLYMVLNNKIQIDIGKTVIKKHQKERHRRNDQTCRCYRKYLAIEVQVVVYKLQRQHDKQHGEHFGPVGAQEAHQVKRVGCDQVEGTA